MTNRITKELLKRGWRRKGLRTRLGLAGGLWAGFFICLYTFGGARYIFMEKPLSINHRGLEKRCGNCHHPFEGVSDSRCATTCHTKQYNWKTPVDYRVQYAGIPYPNEIHFYSRKFDKEGDCLKCHPAECHSRDLKKQPAQKSSKFGVACEVKNHDFLTLPKPFTEKTCNSCHERCERSTRCFDCHQEHADGMPISVNRPEEVFQGRSSVRQSFMTPRGKLQNFKWEEQTILNFEMRRGRMHERNCMACHPDILHRKPPTPEQVDRSRVSRTIFRHDSHGHRRYWHCTQCHLHKFPLKRDPDENIFTMEACSKKCHYNDDCAGCHRFHDPIHRPGERVDWPERLRTYNRLIGIQESSIATGETPISTPEK